MTAPHHILTESDECRNANIAALKMQGVTDVLSLSAVGGLRADLPPGTTVETEDRFVVTSGEAAGTYVVDDVQPNADMTGAQVVLISDRKGHDLSGDGVWMRIEIPECEPAFQPMLTAVPIQLLAFAGTRTSNSAQNWRTSWTMLHAVIVSPPHM